MGLLKFNQMDEEQKLLLTQILRRVFENDYSKTAKVDIQKLGQLTMGEKFQLLPRYTKESHFTQEKTGNINFMGEVMQVLRHAQPPISFVGKLAIEHLGFGDDSVYARAMLAVSTRVEEDTRKRMNFDNMNPYHNEWHEMNALVASMALGKGENLSKENRALNAIIMAFHDHGHDSLQNEHESVQGKSPDRLERNALKLMGLEEIDGKIQITDSQSPLRHLQESEQRKIFQRVLDTVFPMGSFHVRNLYQSGDATEDAAARAMVTAADLAESRTLAGNLGNSVAFCQELAYAAARTQNHKHVREIFMGVLSSEKRAFFITSFAPPYTKGEEAIGLSEENAQLAHHLSRKEEPVKKIYAAEEDEPRVTIADIVAKARLAVKWAV